MAGPKLEAQLGLNTQEFQKGMEMAKGTFSKLGSEMLSVGSGIAAATFALSGLKDAFLATELGARVAGQGMAVLKQIFYDLMNLSPVVGANIGQVLRNVKEWDDLKTAGREVALEEKRGQIAMNQLLYEASDQTKSYAERIKDLTDAKKKNWDVAIEMNMEAQKEKNLIEAQLILQPDNTKLLDQYRDIKLKILDISGKEYENKRTEMMITRLQIEQQRLSNSTLSDGYTKMVAIAGISHKVPWGGGTDVNSAMFGKELNVPSFGKTFKSGLIPMRSELDIGKLRAATQELSEQQKALVNLSGTFANFFSGVNLGFQGMVDGVISGIKRLVMELMAKAAILAILTAVTGGSFAGFGKMLFGGMSDIFGGLSTGGVGSRVATPLKIPGKMDFAPELNFKISGKDLVTVLNRNT
jgi:hypothetical protein